MLVQYEAKNTAPPPLASTWSHQDNEGSWLLILLAWVGVLIGVGGALYWARLSILGAIYGSKSDVVGFAWLSITAAGAAIIAPILWPFLKTRRKEIATFVLVVGIISWVLTSISGTLFLIEKAETPQLDDHGRPATMKQIEASIEQDRRSIANAERDCFYGVMRGCDWLNSDDGNAVRVRLKRNNTELASRRQPQPRPATIAPVKGFDMADAVIKLRSRFMLFMMVLLGGAIALALIWGPAEALKAMYSEPGTLMGPPQTPVTGLPEPSTAPLLGNPIDAAFETWANQCLERARGERAPLATMHAHYVGWCLRRGFPTFASDAAFGRALNRSRDPMNPGDLGGPMVRHQAYPLKTGGKMEYVDVRIRPDDILDEIEGHMASGP